MTSIATSFLLTLNVSVYTPGANAISGNAITASGDSVADGQAACGFGFPFGTEFEVLGNAADELRKQGIHTKVVCKDRGGMISDQHLDISLTYGENSDRLRRAFAFGRQWTQVRVTLPQVHYPYNSQNNQRYLAQLALQTAPSFTRVQSAVPAPSPAPTKITRHEKAETER